MGFNSIEKALVILKSFTPDNQPLGTLDISRRLDLNQSTVCRVLSTLKEHGFVDQDPQTRRYRLGPAAAQLGRAIGQSQDGRIVALAKPFVDQLRDDVGETVHLEIMTEDRVRLAYAAKGPRPLTVSVTVGDRMAIHANAGAKVILAFSTPDVIEKHLSGRLPVFTAKTLTEPASLRSEYARIRLAGVGYDREEFDDDISAVAAPVFNHENRALAAVVVVGPSHRMDLGADSVLVSRLKETAGGISARLLSSADLSHVFVEEMNRPGPPNRHA